MMLYVNGDSHSYGLDASPDQRFSSKVAQKFNLTEINQAIPGASNQRILRTTREFINKGNLPDLILIGWSTWEREEWYHNDCYYDINSAGHNLPPELQQHYKEWVVKQDPDVVKEKSRIYHTKIYELHLELIQKNIPHLFFNGFYNFFGIDEDQKKYWGVNYFGPYDNDSSYFWNLLKHGHESNKSMHFDDAGHQFWSEQLIGYIERSNLL